ncbi:helix-turn-helix domain-containing protein [Candidatus Marinimicrobia bacterium]|nr:helix-turn-helix domain-containing protein [Candidatus Neomarinimicrobiota bacterium]
MIEKTILIPILERLERIESIVSGQAKKYERMMTIKDVTTYCRVCDATVRRAVSKGYLKPIKSYGKKLFRRIDVDNWLRM